MKISINPHKLPCLDSILNSFFFLSIEIDESDSWKCATNSLLTHARLEPTKYSFWFMLSLPFKLWMDFFLCVNVYSNRKREEIRELKTFGNWYHWEMNKEISYHSSIANCLVLYFDFGSFSPTLGKCLRLNRLNAFYMCSSLAFI